jgi:zinc D-Ala-D-Ala dipeptidase
MRAFICLVLLLGCSPPPLRVEPVRPIEELRKEALAATPPVEEGKRPSELVELTALDPSILLDVRYASTKNFLGTKVYEQGRAFLQLPAAEAVVRVHRALAAQGFGLLIHDAYRPWYVTKIFWDATPTDKHDFVADPAKGSRHNRGCAVDLTLFDRKTGRPVEMPSPYDEFSERSRADYPGGTAEQRRMRGILRTAMEAEGFAIYDIEWWHFDYKDWKSYRIENVSFDAIARSQ